MKKLVWGAAVILAALCTTVNAEPETPAAPAAEETTMPDTGKMWDTNNPIIKTENKQGTEDLDKNFQGDATLALNTKEDELEALESLVQDPEQSGIDSEYN